MDLKLFNTRGRNMQALAPLNGNEVRMYCCGPTVYHFAHIGNLRSYLFEDTLRRTLQFLGYTVNHVMNVTDVGHLTDDGDEGEDKMIKASRERGMSVWDIARHYTQVFFDDCARLNISRPDTVCNATDHIEDMINLIKRLEERGLTYIADGNVYYDVSKFPYYNELGQLDKQELRAGARIEVDQNKRNVQDFVLWFTNSKFKDQAMIWDSPWGRGYPGWHIECSAMSHRYLGEQFDIHCGGVDHIKVHHTNEIAQTEGATGKHPWVNIWMHGEFLVLNNAKMSKSSGDFLTLSRLVELGYDPLDYRFMCLGAHYRIQLNFSDDNIASAKAARSNLIDRLKSLIVQAETVASGSGRTISKSALAISSERLSSYQKNGTYRVQVEPFQTVIGELNTESKQLLDNFLSHISDDLNMPRALASIFEVLKSGCSALEKLKLIGMFDQVLGLELLANAEKRIAENEKQATEGSEFTAEETAEITKFIEERAAARKAKNFARSDEIRDLLKVRGIVLVDSPQGTSFKRV